METHPNFLEGEKVILETKPASFIAYFLLNLISIIFLIFFLIFILGFVGGVLLFFLSMKIGINILEVLSIFGEIGVVSLLLFLLPVGLLCMVIYCALEYRWEYYWITNLRIIQRKGLIGYHFYSTPYERMSDVILSRSWIERILGVGSVRVQTLAGSITYGGPFGAELRMIALANPEEVQKIAWQFLKKKPTGL